MNRPSASLGQGLVPATSLGTAIGLYWRGKILHLEVKAICRGPTETSGDPPPNTILPSLLCRSQDSQGYSHFPSLTGARRALTGQTMWNPDSNSSVGPADPSSLRVDGQKLAYFPRVPRKVSLGSADLVWGGRPLDTQRPHRLPAHQRGPTSAGCPDHSLRYSGSRTMLSFGPSNLLSFHHRLRAQ